MSEGAEELYVTCAVRPAACTSFSGTEILFVRLKLIMPLIILAIFIVTIFSFGFIAADIFLFREWYLYKDTLNDDYAMRCLVGAIALLLFNFSGKTLISRLVSSGKRKDDDPKIEYSDSFETLQRPDGSKIHIQYAGKKDGQPILFVHGWNATSAEWFYQKKKLSYQYRLVLIDLPGLGKSTRPANKDFSLTKMAADLEAVIDHARLRDVVLYGHSIGGMIILTYCTQFATAAKKVKAIILQHTTYTNPVRTALFSKFLTAIQKPVLEPLCHIMIALSPVFWFSKWMSYLNGNLLLSTRLITFAGTQTPQQLDFISKLSAMAPPAVFARGALAMFRYDVTKQIEKLKMSALIIAADRDRLTLPEASYTMKNKIGSSQLRELSPAGHQGLVERNEEVNNIVQGFLGSLTKRPSEKLDDLRPQTRRKAGGA
jgi:pimeloyl-ACP methyl ester carboxylesterase